jgi:stage IV sporulation protein B
MKNHSPIRKFPMNRMFLLSFLSFVLLFFASLFLLSSYGSPLRITLIHNQPLLINHGNFIKVDLKVSKDEGIQVFKNEEGVLIKPLDRGYTTGKIVLFETFRLRKVEFNVVEEKKLFAMGKAVGLRLYLDGVLVEAISPVHGMDGRKYTPSKDAGIRRGDILIKANHLPIQSAAHFTEMIHQGETLVITGVRDGNLYSTNISPKKSRDEKFKVGLWIKDTINGIGTITFCSTEEGLAFGGLGHGISNYSENDILPLQGGEVFYTEITSVKKGLSGDPGELRGDLLLDYSLIGQIYHNTAVGIFGVLDKKFLESISPQSYFIGYEQHVQKGPAYILSNIEGNAIQKYDIQIEKITNSPFASPKGMIIRITDENLIEKTGGIVQGMSGSPIIQNNRIIGAVTHVLIHEPTKGYGLFIEDMLR